MENDRMVVGKWSMVIDENLQYLHAIVDLCNVHKVQPIIVQMPVMEVYKQKLPKEQVALMEDVLHSLDSCAICIEASEWEIPEDGWYNATHLTKESSESFTQELLLEIK